MRKRMFIGGLVAVLAAVLAGGLLASNMGFKLNYTLAAGTQAVPGEIGTSASGTNDIALPDFPQSGMNTANDLRLDINGGSTIGPANGGITKLLRTTDLLAPSYTGKGTNADFPLVAGDAYRVKLTGVASINYIIVGAHNPSLSHVLAAAGQTLPEGGASNSGTNAYNYPYHSVSATANALRVEISGTTGAANGGISKLLRTTDLLSPAYTGKGTNADFNLVPGSAYRIKLTGSTNISFVPNHY